MSIKRLSVLIVMVLCLLDADPASAETRNIYVGDIITIDITTLKISEDEIRQQFQNIDFEVAEIKNKSDGYILSVRSFNVGEYKVLLGDKEIQINICSTLDDIDREEVYEGDTQIIDSGFSFHWRICLYIAAGIFTLTLIYAIIHTLLKKKKPESCYALFLKRSSALSADDDRYFVKLTFYFKEYLEGLHQFRIIGKTTSEIMNELKMIPELGSSLMDIQAWLIECDRLKFTGVKVSNEEKRHHYMELLGIVEKIENNRELNGGAK